MGKQVFHANEVVSAVEWNSDLLRHSCPHPMQTWEWGEARRMLGDQVHRFSVSSCGHTVLLAQVFVRQVRKLPVLLAWVPRGPVCDDIQQAQTAISVLRPRLRAVGCRVLVVQPYVRGGKAKLLWSIPRRKEFTFIVDVSQDLSQTERLLKNKGINRFQREGGVVMTSTDESAIDALKKLYSRLKERKGFRPYGGSELITAIWNQFRASQNPAISARVFTAVIRNEPVNTAMVIRVGNSAHYLWAASDYGSRNLGAGEALQWCIMQTLRAEGVRYYDLEGGDPKGNPGVFKFKQKLGGQLVERPPAGFRIL